ncbi:Alkaline phosphatase 4 precursor [Rubripirellula amarantea]|uniref:Alkaline phosphatase 4 n=1 Tax=Rubripirellula amarantea TaxID=2527999 RepID=A0A5C5WSS4_9BACT|nr:alkaline phosphatase [Rubripirellula amarantea]TWT53540.1 Alkaline phosphatase 4 precursor [Rubripirellula amarantea]
MTLFNRLGLYLVLLCFCFDTSWSQDVASAPKAGGEIGVPSKTENENSDTKPLDATESESETTEPKPDRFNTGDLMRDMQSQSMRDQKAVYGHWGNQSGKFSNWTNHSNRLIPVYTFGITLDSWRDQGSPYADADRLKQLYGLVPEHTLNPSAMYFDQTDIYRLQKTALDAGYTNIILMVFDGMDWQTTQAASIYKQGRVAYQSGRGTGLAIQDERQTITDFGLVVTSPLLTGAKFDVNSQTVLSGKQPSTGGFNRTRGGDAPWHEQKGRDYLMGLDREEPHGVTDSASSATSLTTGVKTFNGSINVAADGTFLTPIARELQAATEMKVGVVTSVPVSHATPGAAYANNVSRKDYQDIARDMIGLPSSSHREDPLPGLDVLIGTGHGVGTKSDSNQGDNFATGNKYLHERDVDKVNIENGGKYVVAKRTSGTSGRKVLMKAAEQAADNDQRLLGFFGLEHLPFQTADGDYKPTFDVAGTEKYSDADLHENPTLAEMTAAALTVLERSIDGFWLMIECGDVDWANHANNLDNSIGAVLSGDEAFQVVTKWVDDNRAWDVTAVIVTADHGHYLVIDDPQKIAEAGSKAKAKTKAQSQKP